MRRLPQRDLMLALLIVLAHPGSRLLAADPPGPQALAFFESKVRPVLAANCFQCHADKKQKGSLRLDSRAGMLKGGDRGPVLVPGAPEKSLLVTAISHADPELKMPPSKKLAKHQIDDLREWVRTGAPWPGSEKNAAAEPPRGEFKISAQDRAYWAFQPIRRPTVPGVRNRSAVGNPIDAFLLARLEERGLPQNPLASRRALIRRAYFDLLGLPPTPEQVEAFVQDQEPDAWERLIDRLLAQPAYGERWARHWLDVVRYAQTNGYERDDEKPYAWRYRDYVIRALNDDKPYDAFIREQLAGDELKPRTDDSIIATGYYRLGVWDDEPDDARQAAYDELDDVLATTSQAFLGLTINCARCHDHKFDPISQRDYYKLLAFLHNIKGYEKARFAADSATFTALGKEADRPASGIKTTAPGQAPKGKSGAATGGSGSAGFLGSQAAAVWALSVREKGRQAPKTRVLIRGNAATEGDEVEPGIPEVLTTSKVIAANAHAAGESTGRRLALADWIASPDNPLTARVLVNRIWQHHFGRGLVPTPNDFGKTGMAPTHPELLDWLAADFLEGGWKIKRMHKLIMMSHAYQLSSRVENLREDEGNEFYGRQNLRRLEAEAIRDAALTVSGKLNGKMTGRGVFPRLSREVIAGQSRPGFGWEISSESELARRSVYLFVKRTMLAPILETLDYNNTAQPIGARPVTTVAPQALMLLNSDFMQTQAEALADRLVREAGADPQAQVRQAYRLALGRDPTEQEQQIAFAYLQEQTDAFAALRPAVTIRPRVPSSLLDSYLRQLQPADFLDGPRSGWTYFRGQWASPYEGIQRLEVPRGPFALWQPLVFGDAVIECEISLHQASELGGVIFRARPQGDEFIGYDLSLDPRHHQAVLRRHTDKELQVLAEAKTPVDLNEAHRLKIEASGARIRVWLDGTVAPLIDVTDSRPLTKPGQLGLRAWGAGLSVRELFVRTAGKSTRVDSDKPLSMEAARRQALQALCLVILNLNEFVYVD
jgi:mono/diheme cytochrome c family protein